MKEGLAGKIAKGFINSKLDGIAHDRVHDRGSIRVRF